MSTATFEDIFISAARLHDRQPAWLDEIVREVLAQTASESPEWRHNGCLLSDIGDFLIHGVRASACIADLAVNGPHIDIYTKDKIQKMSDLDDFSELHPLDYLAKKHSLLKSVWPYAY